MIGCNGEVDFKPCSQFRFESNNVDEGGILWGGSGLFVLIFLKVLCLFKNLNIHFVSFNWWITKFV